MITAIERKSILQLLKVKITGKLKRKMMTTEAVSM